MRSAREIVTELACDIPDTPNATMRVNDHSEMIILHATRAKNFNERKDRDRDVTLEMRAIVRQAAMALALIEGKGS